MIKLLRYLLLFLLLFTTGTYAQEVQITYDNPDGIEICGNQETYQVTITNNTGSVLDANSLLEINLPEGISYVGSSVSSNFLDTTVTDTNVPVFTSINALEINTSVTLQFDAIAGCDTYTFIDTSSDSIKNDIRYTYNVSTIPQPVIEITDADTYNLYFRDVDLTIPDPVLGQPNQIIEVNNTYDLVHQQVNIGIPGNSMDYSQFLLKISPTSELEFKGVSSILIDAVSYTVPTLLTSGTTELSFNATDLGISNFNPLMNIEVVLDYRAKSCFVGNTQHVEYTTAIICASGTSCDRQQITGDFVFNKIEPHLTYSFDSDNGIDLCGNTSSVIYTITNEVDSQSPTLDISLKLGQAFGAVISNAQINGVSIDATAYISAISPLSTVLIPGLTVLTDEDGDGIQDDLAPGASLVFTCDVLMTLPDTHYDIDKCDSGLYRTYFSSEFYSKTSKCDSDFEGDNELRSYFNLRDVTTDVDLTVQNDLIDGQPKHVQFCISRLGGGSLNQIYDDNMFFEAEIEIPCGAQYVAGSGTFTSSNDDIMATTSTPTIDAVTGITTLIITVDEPFVFPGTVMWYGGCFDFDILLDCDSAESCSSEESILDATAYGTFSQCTSQKINLGCAAKELMLHCIPLIPGCPSPLALMATDFDASRTSFGTTMDGTSITIEGVDNGTFTGLNTNGAYACDSIRTEITGTTACDLDGSNSLYGFVWYSHPEDFPFLTMTGAEYDINEGVTSTATSFNLRPDLSTSTKKVFEIQVTGAAMNVGDIINIRGLFTVDDSINNTQIWSGDGIPDFPNVYSIDEFRGGLSLGNNPLPDPYHYGTAFEVYGLNYSSGFAGAPASCSAIGDFRFGFAVRGGSGDDFPNEFRNVLQLEGPVEVTIPAAAAGEISFNSATYTMTGVTGAIPLSIVPVTGSPGVFRIYDDTFGVLEEFRPFDKTSGVMWGSIRMIFNIDNCNIPEGQTIDGVMSYIEKGYAQDTCSEVITPTLPQRIISDGSGFNTGDLSLDVVNPSFQSVNTVTSYKIDVNNTSTSNAQYPWIKFTYPDNIITVTNAIVDGYDIVGAPVVGVNTLLLRLQPISDETGMQGHIDVTLNNCDTTDEFAEIQIETGISCSPISDSILDNLSTTCPLDSGKKVELEIIKSDLWMDVIPLFDSSAPLPNCEDFQYLVQISNNEKANITDPNFQIDVPTGMNMSVQYRYPVTEVIDTAASFTATGFSAPISITSGTAWNLEGTAGVLPGFIANTATEFNNYYQLLVTLTPSCDYNGVDKVYFTTKGTTNCNVDAGVPTFETTPNILGLEEVTNYTPELSMEINQNGDCGNYTATVHYSTAADISGSTGVLTITLPNEFITADSLNFDLPSTGATDFTFDFTTANEFCEDADFVYDIVINTELSCSTDDSCVSTLEVQETLTENVCCTIGNCEIIPSMTILNGSVDDCNAIACNMLVGINTSVAGNSETTITAVTWNVYELTNLTTPIYTESGTLGHEFSDGTYNVCMTVMGIDTVNNIVCEETICEEVTINCESCSIDYELRAIGETNFDGPCNRFDIHIDDYVASGAVITDYIWTVTDVITNTIIETIPNTTGSAPTFLDNYEFPGSGTYQVCLAVNAITANGNNCTQDVCTTIEVICPNCSVEGLSFTSGESDTNCRLYDFMATTSIIGGTAQEYEWLISQGGAPIFDSGIQFGEPSTFSYEFIDDDAYEVKLIVRGVTPFGDICESVITEIIEINCDTCVIESIDINAISAVVYDGSCLDYTLNAIDPLVTSGTIDTYSWVITDSFGNPAGTYSGNNVAITLPNSGAPFTVDLTLIGTHENGNECIYQDSIYITPDCEECIVKRDFKIKANQENPCNVMEFVPTFYVESGTVQSYQWLIYSPSGDLVETIVGTDPTTPTNLIYEFEQNGTYNVCLEVVGLNVLGEPCTKRKCVDVVIECKPCSIDTKFKMVKLDKCTYTFINLSSTGSWFNVQYLWDFGDGNTSTDFEPTHVYTVDGIYTVTLTVTAENEVGETCSATFESKRFKVRRCKPRRVAAEIDTTEGIKVFPNPNKGIFTIALNEHCESCEVEVYNALGSKIYHQQLKNGREFLVDISGSAKGMYLIKVTDNTETKSKKIIIH